MSRLKIDQIIARATPALERVLTHSFAHLLGPGRQFVVEIGVRSVPVAEFMAHEKSLTRLSKQDWKRMLARRWKPKYLRVLEVIRANGNRPTMVNAGKTDFHDCFHASDRERLNKMLKKSKLPFFVRNTVYSDNDGAKLQVVHR